MTTPTPDRLVQLQAKAVNLHTRVQSLIEDYEGLLKRRLPDLTKQNLTTALMCLRSAEKDLRNTCEAFLGE